MTTQEGNVESARAEWRNARDEAEIMRLCIQHGHMIIGELICSATQHDVVVGEIKQHIEEWTEHQRLYEQRMSEILEAQREEAAKSERTR